MQVHQTLDDRQAEAASARGLVELPERLEEAAMQRRVDPGAISIDGDTLNFGQLSSTMMGCEEPVMQQETNFLQTLGTAAIFTVAGDTLTITTAADATLVFTRAS